MNIDEAKARMIEALKAAKESWQEAQMPMLHNGDMTAIAIIAVQISEEMDR